jgi:hypothetical protein
MPLKPQFKLYKEYKTVSKTDPSGFNTTENQIGIIILENGEKLFKLDTESLLCTSVKTPKNMFGRYKTAKLVTTDKRVYVKAINEKAALKNYLAEKDKTSSARQTSNI